MINESAIKYYLGIDWGKSLCGLALAENENRIASGICEVKRENLLDEVKKMAKEHDLEKIVIGFSKHVGLKGNGVHIDELKKKIEKIGCKVALEDESFSTRLALEHLSETNKKNISKNDNIESARIILQSWLDKRG